ncbi:hypothetical protein Ancab_018531 [Ancistrocladus abbreviatus]
MKVSDEMIKAMHDEAEKFWVRELWRFMMETRDSFVNAIYDSEPLEQIFWGNVVLVGDATHQTSHCARSTNMSVLDAASPGMWCNCCYHGPIPLHGTMKTMQRYRDAKNPYTMHHNYSNNSNKRRANGQRGLVFYNKENVNKCLLSDV